MLINFSNHPVTEWSEDQLATAKKEYGIVADLPFPKIDPAADNETLMKLSTAYLKDINSIFDNNQCAKRVVHIVGEFRLVYMMVLLLQKQGISCICATRIKRGGDQSGDYQFQHFKSYLHYEKIIQSD